MRTQNLALSAVAAHLDLDETLAAATLRGIEPINTEQRKVIALLFRGDPRRIFTDIPPPAKCNGG